MTDAITEPIAPATATESRPAVYLPSYKLGDEGQPNHFTASTSRENAAIEARSLAVGDAAFIKRSDLKWTYALVTELVEPTEGGEGDATSMILRFEVDKDKNRKSFPDAQWGKYIRVINVDPIELARMKEGVEETTEEVAATTTAETPATAEEATPEEAPKEEEAPVADPAAETPHVAGPPSADGSESVKSGKSSRSNKSSKSTKSSKSNKSSSWMPHFSLFGTSTGSKKEEIEVEPTPAAAAVPETVKEEEEATTVPVASEAPITETPADAVESDAPAVATASTTETPIVEPMSEDPAAAALAATSFPKPTASSEEADESPAPVAAAPAEVAPAAVAPIVQEEPVVEEDPNDTKENSAPTKMEKFTAAMPFVASPNGATKDSSVSGESNGSNGSKDSKFGKLRTPLNLKKTLSIKKNRSIVNKIFSKSNKDKEEKIVTYEQSVAAFATSAVPVNKDKKEWFDPEASEVDYDKNPTDLFQALEARQFSYAEEMFKQVNNQFTKECKTWVVARGQKKGSQLRFRALPLHAALVFGAPGDMVTVILNAYPKASRGRDVKGRLPIHLAMEHNASEEIMVALIEAFPKGFFALDKKEMTPLDYINGNMDRKYMKKYIPMLMAANVDDERIRWEVEKDDALAKQRVALKNDPVYMADVVEQVTAEMETTYAKKMGMLEGNYQKEIQLLNKRHDGETQALLEGFEVKLNFERKLNKLKGKA